MKTKKKIIEGFLKANSIKLESNTYFAKDLQNNNWKALRFPAFAISQLSLLKNLKENIQELANIKVGDNQAESKYRNQLTEFFGIWFISYSLKLKIIAIESKTSSIVSPYVLGNRSCDILVKEKSNLYFELKDLSKQILSRRINENVPLIDLTPSTPTEKNRWIKRMIREAAKKGANFLICHMPVWNSEGVPGFGSKWLRRIFKNSKRIAKKEYLVKTKLVIPIFFQGVYLIKGRRYLLLKFENSIERDIIA